MSDSSADVRSGASDAEWEQRVHLAACYRLAALYGWDDVIFTHISARVPGPEHHFLINPYGFLFMYVFEAACAIQIRAQCGYRDLITIDPRIIAGAQAQAMQVTRGAGGTLAWPGLLRRLDRRDASYRS